MANDRDYLPAALHLIDTAQTRIRMIEFVIYDDGSVATLLDHLIQAQGRGVEVMVLADEESGNTDRALARLAAAGVQTRLDSPQVTTHNKLLIADDNTLVGSHNLSSNALDRNTESSVWIRDTEVTAYYQEYFQALWADSATDPTLSWNGSDRIIPLKNRDVAGNLFRCIQGAQHQVRVVLYAMTYNRDFPGSDPIMLVDALVAAKARRAVGKLGCFVEAFS